MAEDNKIWYSVGADTSGLSKDLDKAKSMFKGLSDTTQSEGLKMDNMMVKLAASVGVAFTAQQAYQFAKSVAEVRGQFQQLEAAFKTMLGSKAQSDQLMSQLIKTAATTPFQLTEVATGAKSLLAYGTSAEKVNETLKMLGNVASGMNIPLSDMVYLYGTTQVQGRLYAQDMRQFMGRGIPLVEELSKQFGVNKDKISDMVTAGKIGFPEVEKAFQSMTGQGGKFYNMMDSQSKTITGQISNLKDAYDEMLNSMGKESEGVISATIGGVKTIIENYETIGRIIAGLVAVYGTYKAAVIATNAAHEIAIGIKIANAVAGGTLTAAELAGQAATNLWTMAQIKLNAAMLTNPYVLAATAIVGTVAAIILLTDHTTSAERAQKMYDDEVKQTTDALEKHRQEVDKNIETATNMALTDTQRAGAINRLRKEYPDILKKYDLENLSLAEKLRLIKEINEAQGNKAVVANTKKVENTDAEINRLKKENETKTNYDIEKYGRIQSGTRLKIQSNEKAIQDLQKLRVLQTQNVESDNVNKWTANIKNMTDAQIQAQLNERARMLHELSKKGDTAVGEIKGIGWFRADELKNQNAALEAELANRRKVVVQDKAFWEEQKKKAQETQDALGQDQINGKEWKTQQKLIDEADRKIKARGTSKKSGKSSSDTPKEPTDFTKEILNQTRSQQDALYAIEQQNIDLMDEGVNREIRQNKLNHDKKIEEFKRQREDELQKMQDIEQTKWKESGKKGKTTVTAILPANSITNYASLIKNENDLFEAANKKTWDNALNQYYDFKTKQKKINEDYIKAEAIINASSADKDTKTAKLAEAKNIRDKDLKSLTDDLMRTVGLIDLMQGDGSELIKKKIKEVLPLFDDISKLSHSELGKVKDAINKIEFTPEQIASIKEAGLSLEEFNKLLEKAKGAAKETTNEQDWQKTTDSINKIAAAAEKLGNALQNTGGILGTIGAGLSSAAGAMSSIREITKPGATTADKVSAGISGVADLYGMITGQIEANKRAQEEWNAKIAEAAQKARMARIELEAYKESNLFGIENPFEKAIAGANQYASAMVAFNDASAQMNDGKVQTGTTKRVSGGNTLKGAGSGAAAGAAIGSIIPGVGTLIGGVVGGAIGAIGGLFSKKSYPVFKSLKEQYGEIYNSKTFELNPKILQDYSKLDAATKKMVDNWKEIKDKAVEAQNQMKEAFRDLAGNIGEDLSTALVDAFTDGNINSAIESFQSKITDTIEDIIQKMVFAKYFEGMFKSLEEKMNASFSDTGDQTIVDELVWFTSEYPKALEDYNKAMADAQTELQKQGYDLFGQAERTGSSKGITTASQDTVDELNGRFTAIQGHTYSINETLKSMAVNSAAMLNHLSNIDSSTNRLGTIEQFMNEVRAGINQINTKGINIKV